MSPVRITVKKDGPYRVEIDGDLSQLALVDHEGNPVATPGPRFSLCRCGASSRKPFCDQTHSRIGFKGAEEAAQRMDAAGGPSTPTAPTTPTTPTTPPTAPTTPPAAGG